MINVLIIPILFILLIILFYFLRKNMHKIMKPGLRKVILAIYLSLLVVATIVFFIMQPKINMLDVTADNPPSIYDLIYEDGDLTMLESYELHNWDMVIEEETIRLQVHYTGQYVDAYIPVLVIEDESKENEAHITHYETPSILNGIDISEYISLPEIEVGDSLIAAKVIGDIYEHDLHSIENETVLRQFQTNEEIGNSFDMGTGETLIVLIIPKETTIHANEDQFDIVYR